MPVHSHDMRIQKIAVNITFALKELPANMVAQLEPFSRSEKEMVRVTAKTQKMFPDGKSSKYSCIIYVRLTPLCFPVFVTILLFCFFLLTHTYTLCSVIFL